MQIKTNSAMGRGPSVMFSVYLVSIPSLNLYFFIMTHYHFVEPFNHFTLCLDLHFLKNSSPQPVSAAGVSTQKSPALLHIVFVEQQVQFVS